MTNNLRKIRDSKRYTLKEVAEKTGISYSVLSRIELGERDLNEYHIRALADFYKVPTDYILCRETSSLPQTIVYKDRDITYQAVLENINKFSKDDLLKLSGEYGFTKMPVHNLRHYFASRCLTNGIDKKTYSKWMGHADIEVTLDVYSHITSDFEKEQIELMAKKRHKKE